MQGLSLFYTAVLMFPERPSMNAPTDTAVIKQHLIDPEICIRCNTCESTCPVGAITHDAHNYVVDVTRCNWCNDCIAPCPTGAIDNYRKVLRADAYSLQAQLGWERLPAEIPAAELGALAGVGATGAPSSVAAAPVAPVESPPFNPAAFRATLPPWSAAHAYTNLYGPRAAQKSVTARVTRHVRLSGEDGAHGAHHIVLDFGALPFPVLEGQRIGVVPPGLDANGKPHVARQYSIASPRHGEDPECNNLALIVKRVDQDAQGRPARGVASHFLCDLKVGDPVEVIGPFGASFLMPNHPRANIVMIGAGTGAAPLRAMVEWRRRLTFPPEQGGGADAGGAWASDVHRGKLMLFLGARTLEELPYPGDLLGLPKDFIDVNLALSRAPGAPKRHVQDAMRERAADLAVLLQDRNTCFYICGLKRMEEGVLMALRDVAIRAGLSWNALGATLKREGRLHIETY